MKNIPNHFQNIWNHFQNPMDHKKTYEKHMESMFFHDFYGQNMVKTWFGSDPIRFGSDFICQNELWK